MTPNQLEEIPACKGVDPCTDIACQKAIVKTHIITEKDFQSRIIASAGAPKVLSAADIQSIIDGGLCGTDGLLLDPNVASNAELNPVAAPPAPNMVCYSFPFLKGILTEMPETFSFYVATGGASGKDVIFSVALAGATQQFFDCSDHWPYLPPPEL